MPLDRCKDVVHLLARHRKTIQRASLAKRKFGVEWPPYRFEAASPRLIPDIFKRRVYRAVGDWYRLLVSGQVTTDTGFVSTTTFAVTNVGLPTDQMESNMIDKGVPVIPDWFIGGQRHGINRNASRNGLVRQVLRRYGCAFGAGRKDDQGSCRHRWSSGRVSQYRYCPQ